MGHREPQRGVNQQGKMCAEVRKVQCFHERRRQVLKELVDRVQDGAETHP